MNIASLIISAALHHFAITTPTIIQSHVCQAPSHITITQPSDGSQTDVPHIFVAGQTDAATSVTILDNAQPDGTTTSDASGNYAIEVPLVAHQNTLIAKASDACGNSVQSTAVTVTYNKPITPPPAPAPLPGQPSAQPPLTIVPTNIGNVGGGLNSQGHFLPSQSATSGQLTLYVQSPSEFTTTEPSVVLFGATNIPAQLRFIVDGTEVANPLTDEDGHYKVRIPVKLGQNDITIIASAKGQIAQIHLKVQRQAPPAPAAPSFWQRYGKLIIAIVVGLIILLSLVKARRMKRHNENQN